MSMFKEVADIQTADMLKLPVPKAEYKNIAVKPSDIQSEMVKSLSERAEKVRNGGVDSSQDNMLLITNDGRKLALDQRMIDPLLPDFEAVRSMLLLIMYIVFGMKQHQTSRHNLSSATYQHLSQPMIFPCITILEIS